MNLRSEKYNKLTWQQLEAGTKVTYYSFNKKEHGKVKRLPSDDNYAFVVYHCDNNWDNYYNYTAARTEIRDLVLGWR